jgi:TonB family protein
MIPSQVYRPLLKQGSVAIDFYVMKDGEVEGIKIHKPSDDEGLDRAASASVTASSPFPPLPSEFTGDRIRMRFHYFYNLQPEISLRVIPSFDVQVRAGALSNFRFPARKSEPDRCGGAFRARAARNRLAGNIGDRVLYRAFADRSLQR